MATARAPEAEGDGLPEAFRRIMRREFRLIAGLQELPDHVASRLMTNPEIIGEWCRDRERMPKALADLGLDESVLRELQVVMEQYVTSRFKEAWAWAKTALRPVKRVLTADRQSDIARALLAAWKSVDTVIDVIEQAPRDPYRLLCAVVVDNDLPTRGAGGLFDVCDRIAGRNGGVESSRIRGAVLCAVADLERRGRYSHILEEAVAGKASAPPGHVLRLAAEYLGRNSEEAGEIADTLAGTWREHIPTVVSATAQDRERVVATRPDWPLDMCLFTTRKGVLLRAERASLVFARQSAGKRTMERLDRKPSPLPRAAQAMLEDGALDEMQRQGVEAALRQPLSVVTGGPGTGKTHSASMIRRVCEALGWSVIGLAPTAMAAKVLTERAGIPSRTVHSALMPNGHTSTGSMGQVDVCVVDESSMLDTYTYRAVVLAAHDACAHLVLMGDVNQLPPVGPGDSFRSLLRFLEAKRPETVTRLVVNHRHDPRDVSAAWLVTGEGDWAWNDTIRAHHVEPFPSVDDKPTLADDANEAIVAWVEAHRGGRWQILTPTNHLKAQINRAVRGLFQPPDASSLAAGDRVMQQHNAYKRGLINGDQGTVTGIKKGIVSADFDGTPIEVEVAYAARNWEFAWASTVHKAQGGQWEEVLIVAPAPKRDGDRRRRGAKAMERAALYTAITRVQAGGTVTILSDDPDGLVRAARTNVVHRDETFHRYLEAKWNDNEGRGTGWTPILPQEGLPPPPI